MSSVSFCDVGSFKFPPSETVAVALHECLFVFCPTNYAPRSGLCESAQIRIVMVMSELIPVDGKTRC